MSSRRARNAGLVHELQGSHRFVLAVLTAVLTLSVTTSGYLILVSQPRLSTYVELAREVRETHEGMLDQDGALRAWLATGDRDFLVTSTEGLQTVKVSAGQLLRDVTREPRLNPDVLRMLLLGERWQAWARTAATRSLTPAQRQDGTLRRELLRGASLFEAYRVAEARAIGDIKTRRADAIAQQTTALVATLASYLVLLGAATAVAVQRRRRLRATVLRPLTDLQDTILALRAGDLSARPGPTVVPELAEIGSALGLLADEVAQAAVQAAAREQRLASLAARFETVVSVGREIAGSLSVRYVSITVTSAAAELLGAATVLWLRGENEVFEATHRSEDPHGVTPPLSLRASELVARAAAEGQVLTASRSRAYPLILAGTVTAVLEVSTARVDPDTEQVLGSLLSTAAAALESAHLHSTARELADQDGLTQLPNRRRFEVDADGEWERCRRYGRPLSLVMLDLDRFKTINDTHGHLIGDQVLREAAKAVAATLRTTDTAYRYGGEEIVVLLRETGLQEATAVSERLRRAVSAIALAQHPQVRVSTSAGVATRQVRMQHHTDLVAEADAALYEAKKQGRDRVVTAWSGGETLFHGEPDTLPASGLGV